ncbi:MAG: phosphate signaling complex protein PhoU [Chloroflexota bacterium]
MPTRVLFDRSLIDIRDHLLRLSSMTDKAIVDCMKALQERNADLAQQVSANDSNLNDVRYAIEEKCYTVIATQQPNATDLRDIVGSLSVATNLERIGDHAAGIARLTLRMIDQPLLKPLVDIPQMAEIGREMVKGAVDAFLEHDAALAEKLVERDKDVDRLQDQVYKDLLEIMIKDTATIERATFLLWVSHNLERIGDRATNICERAVYAATGELKEFHATETH